MIFLPAGLAIIKQWEGLRLSAYLDQAGISTIGYGHILDVQMGDVCTDEQAIMWLGQDIFWAHTIVERAAGLNTTNTQFSAMISLCYNIGAGGFQSSTVLRCHRSGQFQQAADAFLLWDKLHIDGVLTSSNGLLARRTSERGLYLTHNPGLISASGKL